AFNAAVKPWGQTIPWPLVGGLAAALVVASVGYTYRDRIFSPATAVHAPVAPAQALAILPFRNASGDPQLDWLGTSIGEMLGTDMGQSAQLRTV
ncbi:hypothetical protein ACWTQZ_26460, partial [Escherichia coli]